MTEKTKEQIKQAILTTLYTRFSEPNFDSDEGQLRIADHDDSAIYLGLYAYDATTGQFEKTPASVWTIEVTCSTDEVT